MKIKLSLPSQKKSEAIIANCIACGKCVQNCEMLKTFTTSPKELFQKPMTKETPFSCQLCDHCLSICPKGIDLRNAFLSIRQDAQQQMKIKTRAVDIHQKSSFSSYFSSQVKPNKKVFFPGCSLSAYDPDLVIKLYDHIKDEDMSIWASCCGNPTYTLGKSNTFSQQLLHLNQTIQDSGITEIIVACQNCYKQFEEHTEIKVTSIFEVLNALPLPAVNINIDKTMVLHDPCPTRNYSVIHDNVRTLLKKLNVQYSEYPYNRSFTQCCGAGAMVGITNKDMMLKQARQRTLQSDAEAIITYCQECVDTLGREKETLHIFDLLFNDGAKKIQPSIIKRWINRRLVKIKIDQTQ